MAGLSSSTYDIYAQRVNASGVVQWMTDGIAVCMAGYDQTYPRIVSDGSGGAIVTWQDTRSGIYQVYALRATDAGSGPICGVDPIGITFPSAVQIGSSQDTSFTIMNEGFGSLTGSVSESSDQFEILSGGGSFLLSNSQFRVVTVRFEPTAPGTHTCTIETGSEL